MCNKQEIQNFNTTRLRRLRSQNLGVYWSSWQQKGLLRRQFLWYRESLYQRNCLLCEKSPGKLHSPIFSLSTLTRHKQRISVNCYKFLQQAITLSGLGTPTFKNALMAASEIYGHSDRQFLDGILDLWVSSPVDDNKWPCLSMSNWYFTPSNEAHGLEAVPFYKGVDLRGILQNMVKGDGLTMHIHTKDNQVQWNWFYNWPSIKRIDLSLASHRCFASAISCKPKSLLL